MKIFPLRVMRTVSDTRMQIPHVDEALSVCECLTEPSVLVYIGPSAVSSV